MYIYIVVKTSVPPDTMIPVHVGDGVTTLHVHVVIVTLHVHVVIARCTCTCSQAKPKTICT